MTTKVETKQPEKSSPEQVTADEALERMRSFAARKEKFIAAIKKGEDRDISAGTKGR